MRLRIFTVSMVCLLAGLGLGLSMFIPGGVASLRAEARGLASYEPAPFSQALRSGRTVVVHVDADWCPACRQQTSALQTLAGESGFAGVDFVRVDFDTQKAFLKENKVPVQSMILVFRNGQPVKRIFGVVEPEQLQAKLTAALS